jgi:hypothetical protein
VRKFVRRYEKITAKAQAGPYVVNWFT